MQTSSSMAIRPNDTKCFFRSHNFNTNSEYCINPEDGIKTNLALSCQTPTFEGPFRCQLKHVKGKSPGIAESKHANSK